MTKPVSCILNWQPSSVHGWGVYGLNLALNWVREGRLRPIFSQAFQMELIQLDPIRRSIFQSIHDATEELKSQLIQLPADQKLVFALPVLHGLGNGLTTSPSFNQQVLLSSHLIGVVFFEDTALTPEAMERTKLYRMIIAGSNWNREVLQANGYQDVVTIMQGVDHTVFHAENKVSWLPDRFLIFSGGKLEFRKGQDLLLKAVSYFIELHPDTILVTAWQSPWQDLAEKLNHSRMAEPVVYDERGRVDVPTWVANNGIPSQNFLNLGLISNSQIANTVRQMDVALFPNRAEGGTNLVAMECMACGVPVILSRNTGHLDLIHDDESQPTCLTLDDQKPVVTSDMGTDGWGESQVDEIIDRLEFAYQNRDQLRQIGKQGAEFMHQYSWERQSAKLGDLILQLTSK